MSNADIVQVAAVQSVQGGPHLRAAATQGRSIMEMKKDGHDLF